MKELDMSNTETTPAAYVVTAEMHEQIVAQMARSIAASRAKAKLTGSDVAHFFGVAAH
jgi:hypothetical protein